MTGVALVRTGDMAGVFAGGIDAVVATDAGLTDDGAVVKATDQPVVDVMAGLAIEHRGHVIGGFAGGADAIMTGHAGLARQYAVVHDGGHGRGFEALGGMTGITGVDHGNVIRARTGGEDIIVAQGALSGEFFEHSAHVAVFAVQ